MSALPTGPSHRFTHAGCCPLEGERELSAVSLALLDAEVVEVLEGTTGRPHVSSCGDKAATLRSKL